MSGIFLTMKRIPGGVAFVVAGALAVGGLSACGGGTAGKIRNLANGTTAKRIEKFQQRLETPEPSPSPTPVRRRVRVDSP